MDLARVVSDLVVPPLCAACGRACRAEAVLCTRCSRALGAAMPILAGGPQGIDRAWASAPHDGVARALVGALKFRRLLPVAGVMAERMHWLAPGHLFGGAVVAVPSAPPRLRRRGFDPAGELAAALAAKLGAEPVPCLARRGSDHQVGRRRAERIAHPPRIEAIAEAPRSVLLVDDVLTTGATLTACAAALRGAGARRIVALTFTRRL
ncbi:MAG TPA: phosphoribosyltransferase family protein [Solirubrobacterales bacterium]|jgi:predicted amidophosphoribosyltransferase|nr:phosphoribosyltransferase family protein [Solirubrobacterales bacterium]